MIKPSNLRIKRRSAGVSVCANHWYISGGQAHQVTLMVPLDDEYTTAGVSAALTVSVDFSLETDIVNTST